jgi:hypothetical protein
MLRAFLNNPQKIKERDVVVIDTIHSVFLSKLKGKYTIKCNKGMCGVILETKL